ncbi:uclacyanin 1-like [Quercus robur]|uniref:uclacyanin 1-like n=1 Tax=Quercus robur TaxID=38942 RepID=UPI002162DCDD|nr:uclacyanin 1-like [Quercus robur]
MAMLRALMSLAISAMLINLAMAANYTVGGPNGGWDTSTNVQTWASSQSFLVGDNLIFQYAPSHDVVEVPKTDYDSCQASNPIQSYSGGTTTIPLSSPGKRYFICGTAGHCSQGMKLQINTLATSAPPTPSPTIQPPTSEVTPLVPTPAPEESDAPSPTQTPAESTPTVLTPSPSDSPTQTPAESTPTVLPPSPSDSSSEDPSLSPSFTPPTESDQSHQTSSTGSSAETPSSSAHKQGSFLFNITMGVIFVMIMLQAY